MGEIIVGMSKYASPRYKAKPYDLISMLFDIETFDENKVNSVKKIAEELIKQLNSIFEYIFLNPKLKIGQVTFRKYKKDEKDKNLTGGCRYDIPIENCPLAARPFLVAIVVFLAKRMPVKISIV